MIVDGAAIARDIEEVTAARVCALGRAPRLCIFTCRPNLATRRFLERKSAKAEKLGVAISVAECPVQNTTADIVAAVTAAVGESDGIIVQLPLPSHIDIASVLDAVSLSHDVDAIGSAANVLFADGKPLVLPPVVGAIAEIIARHDVKVAGKRVVVVGEGRLVGMPAATWFRQMGAHVRTLNRKTTRTESLARFAREADILVLGAGVPGLITPEMVRDGAVVFDAGSSEDTGKLVGDADPCCAEKSSLFTPVPGGIGPVTVALIFRNLLTLVSIREKGGA